MSIVPVIQLKGAPRKHVTCTAPRPCIAECFSRSQAADAVRPQLIGVLATSGPVVLWYVLYCLQLIGQNHVDGRGLNGALQVETSQRKLLCAALAEAPDSRLMALGAAAAEDPAVTVAGSAVRAASRSRSRAMSPAKPSSPGPSPTTRGSGAGGSAPGPVLSRHHSRSNLGKPPMDPSGPGRRSDSQKRGENGERSPSIGEVLQPLGPIGRLDGQKMWAPFSR
ncbi:pkbA [Symbiodinium natans]|uniref:PkbA protein n=1 Tax=Symbiodinium natans TaxID=878477 RepID=A0A812L5K3_9DINO|nr:pkbA [Symbiodinium natans]